MRVTVCALPEGPVGLEDAWAALGAHVRSNGSALVLLPEMPFSPWLAARATADPSAWDETVREHEHWIARFDEIGTPAIATTRPIVDGGRRFNEGIVWERDGSVRAVHRKRYLPDEPEFHEATWYEPGPDAFEVIEVAGLRVAFTICTELWFHRPFRGFARAGVHALLCPRATLAPSADKWLAGGRAAAVVSGAYCLSSNFTGPTASGAGPWGGLGWIIEPEEGDVLGTTTEDAPFRTIEIDPAVADAAKRTYPRYVRE